MSQEPQRSMRPSWTRDPNIVDLRDTPADAKNYLTLEAAAAELFLAPTTLRDLLSRPPKPSTHQYHPICRPVARIGNTPYYSRQQVADTRRAITRANERVREEQKTRATPFPADEADVDPAPRRGQVRQGELVSVTQMSERTGYAVGSFRRWVTESGFPERAGERRLLEGPGRLEIVWPWGPVDEWLNQTNRRRRRVVPPRPPKTGTDCPKGDAA